MDPDTLMISDEEGNENNGVLEMHVRMLRQHIGLPLQAGAPATAAQSMIEPLFFVELAPYSTNGSRCKLPTCNKGPIRGGEYRLALNPAMDNNNFMRGREGSADFYHVSCFEEIADFSQAAFLDRIVPVTRKTFNLRGVKATSILDGNYLVDGGAERLLLQWKVTQGQHIDERDGVVQPDEPLAQNFADLLSKAGLPGFQPQIVNGMTQHEFFNLITSLAPNESDGPEDSGPWNLFEEYLTARDPESLNNRHDLSAMLAKWRAHTLIARRAEEELNDEMRQERARLGPKAIRALRRLSVIPMPNTQSAFLQGRTGIWG